MKKLSMKTVKLIKYGVLCDSIRVQIVGKSTRVTFVCGDVDIAEKETGYTNFEAGDTLDIRGMTYLVQLPVEGAPWSK